MSHRLQVLLDEHEYEAVRAAARRRRTTVSEFVRQALREARADEPASTSAAKLALVREAATHAYPTGDIEQIEAEIHAGYLDEA